MLSLTAVPRQSFRRVEMPGRVSQAQPGHRQERRTLRI